MSVISRTHVCGPARCAAECLERRLLLSSTAQLVFSREPADAAAGTALGFFLVDVDYPDGAPVSNAQSTVTLRLSSGTFAGGASTVSTLLIGAAIFTNVTIDTPGTYQLIASDGNLGPATSSVFRVLPFDVVASFPATNPESQLTELFNASLSAVDSSGDLFGTTEAGGANNEGTVFEIAHGSNSISTLVSFNSANAFPTNLTIDPAGNLFGTTDRGGDADEGTAFEIAHGTASITTLVSFSYSPLALPGPLTLDPMGDLFGTTGFGGPDNEGTVFEIAHGTGMITTLAAFDSTDGSDPATGVAIDADGDLFGGTDKGGADGMGTVFEIAHGTRSITALASLSQPRGANNQNAVILDFEGDIFGSGGGGNNGSVFEIAHGTSSLTSIASFDDTDDILPNNALAFDSSGDLFGTALEGGTGGDTADGTLFEIARGSNAITTLISFDSSLGTNPQVGDVIFDSGGDLFGTTSAGGANANGTVFEVPSERLTFAQPPTATLAGRTIDGTSGIRVAVGDAFARPLNGAADAITLTLSGGTFSTGSQTATAIAVNGVATFKGLAIDAAGTYTVTASDGSLSASTPVDILSDAIIAAPASSPITGIEGSRTGSVVVATFVGPLGPAPVDRYFAAVDWGDGSPTQNVRSIRYSNGVFAVTARHIFTEEGIYHPTVVVHRLLGSQSTPVMDTATVADAPLHAAGVVFTARAGRPFSVTIARFTDGNKAALASDFTAAVNWGDGQTSAGTVVSNGGGHFHIVASHTYREELGAGYRITVSVQDIGGSTATADSVGKVIGEFSVLRQM